LRRFWPGSQSDRDDASEEVARNWSRLKGFDDTRARRMRLLEELAAAVLWGERQNTLRAMAKERAQAPLSPAERGFLAKTTSEGYLLAAEFADNCDLAPLLELPEHDVGAGFKARAARHVGVSIAEEDAAIATSVWERHGRPRTTTRLPEKWVFLAKLSERVGLGRVKDETLSADWREWRRSEKPR
jgi:hypothetical protein